MLRHAEQLTESQTSWDPPPLYMVSSAVIDVLARSLLSGEMSFDAAYARAVRTFGKRWYFLKPLVDRFLTRFSAGTRPRYRDVARFLQSYRALSIACWRYPNELRIAQWVAEAPIMQPVEAAANWNLPVIETVRDLAQFLPISPAELDWFADLKALANKLDTVKLQHYHYTILRKRSGAARLIENPKPRLKEMQRRILWEILDRVPVHAAAHGFVKGRSIVSFAEPHVGRKILLRLDLQDFFPAFPGARAQALFRTLGYPENVADRLGGICSNATPRSAWGNRLPGIDPVPWAEARAMYAFPHLPQGAPTSPALANLTAYRLDCRLTAFAQSMGAQYTRYADDLAFSGDEEFARSIDRFSSQAAAIVLEEGFQVNFRKTRIMKQSVRQHVAGVVVNERLNLKRGDLELLEAILTNCVRHGPQSQNREAVPDFRAHLLGRVGYVEMVNPAKGARLRGLLQKIEWDDRPITHSE